MSRPPSEVPRSGSLPMPSAPPAPVQGVVLGTAVTPVVPATPVVSGTAVTSASDISGQVDRATTEWLKKNSKALIKKDVDDVLTAKLMSERLEEMADKIMQRKLTMAKREVSDSASEAVADVRLGVNHMVTTSVERYVPAAVHRALQDDNRMQQLLSAHLAEVDQEVRRVVVAVLDRIVQEARVVGSPQDQEDKYQQLNAKLVASLEARCDATLQGVKQASAHTLKGVEQASASTLQGVKQASNDDLQQMKMDVAKLQMENNGLRRRQLLLFIAICLGGGTALASKL